MKNITIAVDDDTYLAARVAAAEKGTSVSALVKRFLQEQGESRWSEEVREMPMSYTEQPLLTAAVDDDLPPGAYGRFPDGAPYYTPGGKPRQPGAMRGMTGWTEDFDTWPDGFLEAIDEGFPGAVKWWLPDDDPSAGSKP